MPREIGAYAAKTHLPQLLRDVARGERITLTLRGRPVAELAPIRGSPAAAKAAVAAMLEFGPIKGVSVTTVEEWIGEGHR